MPIQFWHGFEVERNLLYTKNINISRSQTANLKV